MSVKRGKANNVNSNIAKDIITTVKVKVKSTLEQTTMAQRGSRCIALLFLQPRRKMGVGGQRHAPTALPPGKRPHTHCIGGWVGPRAGLDGCGNSHPNRDSIP